MDVRCTTTTFIPWYSRGRPLQLYCCFFSAVRTLLFRRIGFVVSFLDCTIGSASVVLHLMLIAMTDSMFSMFACRTDVGDDVSHLVDDLSIYCSDDSHVYWQSVTIFLILLNCVIFPSLVGMDLLRRKDQLKGRRTVIRYGFLTTGLKQEVVYWECIVCTLRKIVTVLVVNVAVSPLRRGCYAGLVNLIFFTLGLYLEPYSKEDVRWLTQMEGLSVVATLYTIFACVMFNHNDEHGEDSTYVSVLVVLLMLATWAVFVVIVLQEGFGVRLTARVRVPRFFHKLMRRKTRTPLRFTSLSHLYSTGSSTRSPLHTSRSPASPHPGSTRSLNLSNAYVPEPSIACQSLSDPAAQESIRQSKRASGTSPSHPRHSRSRG
eukprot:Rmarinus@m.9050